MEAMNRRLAPYSCRIDPDRVADYTGTAGPQPLRCNLCGQTFDRRPWKIYGGKSKIGHPYCPSSPKEALPGEAVALTVTLTGSQVAHLRDLAAGRDLAEYLVEAALADTGWSSPSQEVDSASDVHELLDRLSELIKRVRERL